jgi:hypothetical protein
MGKILMRGLMLVSYCHKKIPTAATVKANMPTSSSRQLKGKMWMWEKGT